MAHHHEPSILLPLLLITLSLMSCKEVLASRHLLETTLPTVPELHKVELPPLPTLPTLPKFELPPLPKVEIPSLPHVPTLQEPQLPTFPKPELPTVPHAQLWRSLNCQNCLVCPIYLTCLSPHYYHPNPSKGHTLPFSFPTPLNH
ncbi:hypothetical protein CK203_054588 [Vitis vinifera]|uniref:Protein PELPK1 n=1 Tax=Vitis vinifera TaxID=29760 RepID=A0A438GRQ9_VITVI|nr:hypothetical protein CK203_054588 [Vitis vinifera]